jgi:hypothetical protein
MKLMKGETIKMSKTRKDLEDEVALLDSMVSSLVQLLEEKGIIENSEFEGRVQINTCAK